ncbi:YceD family protein [Lacticaseibacillus songhuajiangensis]|jgi:uncharacterized protein|uniref:YceD family protein n=1 Tax=Lacticaseibacillus songhuajiangensis TaxID=1296539 RepID=UPI000F790C67|nr:YceD family protein [Lacticaseibacillus songhuajiangensis]
MLNWSINTLKQYAHHPLEFDETVDIKKELMERNPDIIDMSRVRAQGTILYVRGDFAVHAKLTAQVTLPSTRSLVPVEVPIDFDFAEIYLGAPDHAEEYEDDELLIPLKSEWLDLLPAVKDNLLLALPLRVLSPEERNAQTLPSGDDWSLITEEEAKPLPPEERADNPFAGLKGMFGDDDDSTGDKK